MYVCHITCVEVRGQPSGVGFLAVVSGHWTQVTGFGRHVLLPARPSHRPRPVISCCCLWMSSNVHMLKTWSPLGPGEMFSGVPRSHGSHLLFLCCSLVPSQGTLLCPKTAPWSICSPQCIQLTMGLTPPGCKPEEPGICIKGYLKYFVLVTEN